MFRQMTYYRPGRVHGLLERWWSHLKQGTVPVLRPRSIAGRVIWVEVSPTEVPRNHKQENLNDGLEPSRVMADLQRAMMAQPIDHPGPWQSLTRAERVYMVTRYFGGFPSVEAADMAGIARDQARRTGWECCRKMAVNLGWKSNAIASIGK